MRCPAAPASAAVASGIATYVSIPNHQSQVSIHRPRTALMTAGIISSAAASPAAAAVEPASARPGHTARDSPVAGVVCRLAGEPRPHVDARDRREQRRGHRQLVPEDAEQRQPAHPDAEGRHQEDPHPQARYAAQERAAEGQGDHPEPARVLRVGAPEDQHPADRGPHAHGAILVWWAVAEEEAQPEPRVEARRPIELKVEYKRLNTFFADYIKNISRGGTFIKTSRPLPVGTEFLFKLFVPGREVPFTIHGEVHRILDGARSTRPRPRATAKPGWRSGSPTARAIRSARSPASSTK